MHEDSSNIVFGYMDYNYIKDYTWVLKNIVLLKRYFLKKKQKFGKRAAALLRIFRDV